MFLYMIPSEPDAARFDLSTFKIEICLYISNTTSIRLLLVLVTISNTFTDHLKCCSWRRLEFLQECHSIIYGCCVLRISLCDLDIFLKLLGNRSSRTSVVTTIPVDKLVDSALVFQGFPNTSFSRSANLSTFLASAFILPGVSSLWTYALFVEIDKCSCMSFLYAAHLVSLSTHL